MWRNPFDFQGYETQLLEQQKTIILHQSLASEKAAHQARVQMSLYQRSGEQHRSDELKQWAGNEERGIQKAINEKREFARDPPWLTEQFPLIQDLPFHRFRRTPT